MNTTTETFSFARNTIADLALDYDLDRELDDVLQGDDRERMHRIEAAIEDGMNALLAKFGWGGDWDAAEIVRDAIDNA